jgi:hypothetical protein
LLKLVHLKIPPLEILLPFVRLVSEDTADYRLTPDLNEFQFRWNTRKLDDGERVAKAIKAIDGKRLEYLIRQMLFADAVKCSHDAAANQREHPFHSV